MKLSREVYVGVFVLTAVVIFLGLTFSLRKMDFLSRRHTYYASFKRVKKLNLGAPVLVAGIPAGEVTALQYVGGDYQVLVTMRIDKTVDLYSDAKVTVSAAAVIGDTTVNIETGKAGPDTKLLPPGSEIQGTDMLELEEMAGQVSEQLEQTLRAAAQILTDPQNQQAIKDILNNMASATGNLDQTTQMINQDFEPLVEEMRKTSANLNAFLEKAQELAQQASADISGTKAELTQTARQWSQTAQTLSDQTAAVGQQASQAGQSVNRLLNANEAALNQSLIELNLTLAALRMLLDQINQGQGTVGQMVTNPELFNQVHDLTKGISQTLTGAQEPMFDIPPLVPPVLAPILSAPSTPTLEEAIP